MHVGISEIISSTPKADFNCDSGRYYSITDDSRVKPQKVSVSKPRDLMVCPSS